MNRFRVDSFNGHVYGATGKRISRVTSGGYIQVQRSGQTKIQAHRLIWESVNGPIPEGMQINHINGIKTDNRIDNLECVTQQENIRHAYENGLINNSGEKHGMAKLKDQQVRNIREAKGLHRDIAVSFGVSRSTVTLIKAGKTWGSVK